VTKTTLIAGCSHAAGSEIDGNEDSEYNRSRSFGNLLSNKLNRKPINIAIASATNHTIARSVINYIENVHDKNDELFVVIAWTDSARIEAPIDWMNGHAPKNADWLDESSRNFIRINQGTPIFAKKEEEIIEYWKRFCVEQSTWLEIYSLNLILQIQYYLQQKNINYVMCNSGYMVRENVHTNHYINLVDTTRFLNLLNTDNSFIHKYYALGYKNSKAKYWHHGEEPHKLFAEELYKFMEKQHVYSALV